MLCGQSANFVNVKVGGPRRVVSTVLRGFDISPFAQRTSYRRAAGCSEGALRLLWGRDLVKIMAQCYKKSEFRAHHFKKYTDERTGVKTQGTVEGH